MSSKLQKIIGNRAQRMKLLFFFFWGCGGIIRWVCTTVFAFLVMCYVLRLRKIAHKITHYCCYYYSRSWVKMMRFSKQCVCVCVFLFQGWRKERREREGKGRERAPPMLCLSMFLPHFTCVLTTYKNKLVTEFLSACGKAAWIKHSFILWLIEIIMEVWLHMI